MTPDSLPEANWSRSGMAAKIERAVESKVRTPPIDRVIRTVPAIKVRSEDKAVAISKSATSTSIKVKPAVACLDLIERDNVNASGQPIDANLVADAGPR